MLKVLLDNTDIVQTIGDGENVVMSQKATTEELDKLNDVIGVIKNPLDGVVWQVGACTAIGEISTSVKTRVVTTNTLVLKKGVTYTLRCLDSNYEFYAVKFNSDGVGSVLFYWGATNTTFTASDDIAQVRVQIRKKTETTVTDVSEYSSKLSLESDSFAYSDDSMNGKIDTFNSKFDGIKGDYHWEQGAIILATGELSDTNVDIRTGIFIPREMVKTVGIDNNHWLHIFYYGKDKNFILRDWLSGNMHDILDNDSYHYVKFSINRKDNAPMDITENTGFVARGLTSFNTRNFLETNAHSLPIATTIVVNTGALDWLKKDFCCFVTADMHGNFKSLSDIGQLKTYLGESDMPILNVGDVVYGRPKVEGNLNPEVVEYMQTAVEKGIYHTMGQHEVGFTTFNDNVGREKNNCLTHEEVVNTYFVPMRDVWGISDLDKPYYYKDFGNTRLIALYQYNIPLVDDESDNTKYKYHRMMVWYGQEQIDWLLETLATTPQNSNVIIMMHQLDKSMSEDTPDTTFFTQAVGVRNIIIDGTPITDIVEAYINRTSINTTYTCTDTATYPTDVFSFTANKDFSGVQGKFVGYLCGDAHVDYVGKLKGTNQQVFGLTACWTSYDCKVKNDDSVESSIVNVLGFNYTDRYALLGRLGQQYSLTGDERRLAKITF